MFKTKTVSSIIVFIFSILSSLLMDGSLVFAQTNHNWERTNPGGGGAIAVVGATANGTIIAASDLSGIYKSTNNGAIWEVFGATQGLMETSITSLGFHPTDGNIFIMGTSIGVYKTIDGGNTIYKVNLQTVAPNGDGYIESIGMSITNTSIGYLAHYENWEPALTFMKTIDGGENWTIVPTNGIPLNTRVVKIMVDKINTDLIYALAGKARFGCSEPYLYKSTNGGSSWTRIATGLNSILDFDLHPTNANVIYLSTFKMKSGGCDSAMWNYAEAHGKFYKSTNGGTSFDQLFNIGGIISVGTNPEHISIVDIINISSSEPNSGTWKTTNGGSTWTHTGFVANWYKGWSDENYSYAFSFNGLSKTLRKDRFNPDKLYGSFGQWAWSTTDGGDHINNISTKDTLVNQYLSTGLENICGNWIDVNEHDKNCIYVGSYDLGFWYSKNNGASWKRSLPNYVTYPDYSWWAGGGSNCNFVLSDPDRENVVWACFSANQPETKSSLFKSTEYGENWTLSNTGLKTMGMEMHGISLDVNSLRNNKRTLYLTQEGDVFRSVDDGVNWTKVFANGGVKFTAVDNFNSKLIYAGGENGLWRTIDSAVTWQEVGLLEMRASDTTKMRKDIVPTYADVNWDTGEADTTAFPWEGVFEIKTDPNIPDRVYVVVYGKGKGLYRSDNAGVSWTKLYTNEKMRGITIAPNNSNVIYLSSSLPYHSGGFNTTSIGILASQDDGANWQFVNDGMAWTSGGRMEIETGTSPNIWAWSIGTGVQKAKIPLVKLHAKIFLEGVYNSTNNIMNTNLSALIPKSSPYQEAPLTVSTIPNNIVDWVLVELRETATGNSITSQSAFLHKDGRIVAHDGSSEDIDLYAPEGNYYIVIKHRNHLAVMSKNPITLNKTTSTFYDFTTGSNKFYGTGGAKQLE